MSNNHLNKDIFIFFIIHGLHPNLVVCKCSNQRLMKIEYVEQSCAVRPTIDPPPPPTVSSPVIWTKGKVNLPIPRNSAKPQITLLHLGLRPIGKGALVVTGGPVGTGADGRFRRLEVGLCIMWLAVAVTVSLLSLPLRGSDPHRPLICGLGLVSPPFPSRNRPSLVNYGIGNVKGDSVAFPPAFISTNCKVHVKKPSF